MINLNTDEMKMITVRGRDYPITIAGNGAPCLVIGNGIIVQRTLSATFKKTFKVYATDLYWDCKYGLPEPQNLTFQHILDDIVEMNQCLGLKKPIIFGFSAYGIVALELVKLYPELASAVIMVGTPVNANSQVVAKNQLIFDLYADAYRKQIDSFRRAQVSKENLSHLSFHDRFKREYIYRDAPRYWHNPEFDCSNIWEGIELDRLLEHFFSSLIPEVNVLKNLEQIQIPIYLAAGTSDFDCCPSYGWSAVENLPSKFTMELFYKSGHYPQYEEQELFDERLSNWLRKLDNVWS